MRGAPRGVVARAAALAAVAAGAAALAGCTHRFESFPFAEANGRSIELRVPAGTSARSRFAAGDASTPVYRLSSRAALGTDQAFALTDRADADGATLDIYADRKTVARSVRLPATGATTLRWLVSLDEGAAVDGFRVTPPAAGGGTVELLGVGTTAMVHGFAFQPGLLTVDGSVEVRSVSADGASARIPASTRDEMAAGTWLLSVDFDRAGENGTVELRSADGRAAAFALDPRASPRRVSFSAAALGFLPASVTVNGSVAAIEISRVEPGAPIPADPGVILDGNPSAWRRRDFELYAWDRYPRVLIFDTRTYAVQDQLFKRLAFFVEKPGTAGRVLGDAEMEGKHGWNAHDYRAEDLARFFTSAAGAGVTLTPLEIDLRGILEAHGIIRKVSAGGWEPGDGAVISISRSSSGVLRDLLLTHESFHGVFFSLPGYRDAVQSAWNGLLPEEQAAWIRFFTSQEYDTNDNYLVVNEFQAYVLQQVRAAIPGRQALVLSRMKAESREGARVAAAVLAAAPDSYLHAFDALQAALTASGGPTGGVVAGVRETSAR